MNKREKEIVVRLTVWCAGGIIERRKFGIRKFVESGCLVFKPIGMAIGPANRPSDATREARPIGVGRAVVSASGDWPANRRAARPTVASFWICGHRALVVPSILCPVIDGTAALSNATVIFLVYDARARVWDCYFPRAVQLTAGGERKKRVAAAKRSGARCPSTVERPPRYEAGDARHGDARPPLIRNVSLLSR